MSSSEANDRPLSRRRAMRVAGFTALASGAGLAASATVAQTSSGDAWPVGVWRARSVSTSPGANRLELQQVFVLILGGIFLIIDSPVERTARLNDIPTAVEYVGPYAGQWLQAATGEVRATAIQINYDGQAAPWSDERVDYTLTYDAATGTMSGRWDWRETAADGSLILAAQGTVEASRVVVGA